MSTKNKTRDSLLKRSGLVIFLLVLLGAVSLIRITITHKEIENIADIDLPLIEILTQIETNQLEQSILLERSIRYAQELERTDFATVNFIKSDSSFRYLAKMVDEDLLIADEQVKKAIESTKEKAHLMKLRNLHISLRKLEIDHTNYENHALELLQLLEQGYLEKALLASRRVETEEDAFNKSISQALMRHELFTETIVKTVEDEELLSRDWIIILTLAFVIVALALAYVYSYRIWRPLEDIRVGAIKLGDGQLDTRIKLRGANMTEDIVESFNSMASRLQKAQNEIDKFVQFSYRTSHDLKAPLANVKSLLKMLDKDMVEANFNAVVNNATKSVEQLEETLKALAKVNHLREELKSEDEQLVFEELVGEVINTLSSQVKEANAIIKIDFKACPTIIYPKSHLQSIFQNLLTNALKYRDPKNSLKIEIQSSTKNNQTFLTVKDNGLGFDSVKHHDNLFKPFQRFHAHESGSGLGLYILKTIIDFHKGNIRVKSLPKKGAQFLLRLN